MSEADCLIVLDTKKSYIAKGETVDITVINR
jgi:molybdopterin biosynthesis enzyme